MTSFSSEFVSLEYWPTGGPNGATVAAVTLRRPETANAFNPDLIAGVVAAFAALAGRDDCRAVVLRGAGKHFSAGADLAWMRDSRLLSEAENLAEAERLRAMFVAVAACSLPTIAAVRGAVYGGAVGLVAACDYAVADENAKFCLSEVKLGLLPAVILPFLARKMPRGPLRRFGVSAQVFSAEEALRCGLVERVVASGTLLHAMEQELNAILAGGPRAQSAFKRLQDELEPEVDVHPELTTHAIAGIRVKPEAQAGLAAFLSKAPPPWVHSLSLSGVEDL